MTEKPLSFLFIDATGKTIAPMAAALLRHYGGNLFKVQMAGTGEINPLCLAELTKHGVPADKLICQPLSYFQTPEQSVTIDVVVRLGATVKQLPPGLYGIPAKVDWPVDDPAEASSADQAAWKARKAFTTLEQLVKAMVKTKWPEARGELQMALAALGKGLHR